MPKVVVDTNALYRSGNLGSYAWRSLIEHASDWGLTFVVPAVVMMETINKIEQDYTSAKQRLESAAPATKLTQVGLPEDALKQITDTITTNAEAEIQRFHERLEEIRAEIVHPPLLDAMELCRRAAKGIAPYTGKDKDGARDTVIWFTVLDIAACTGDEVWFVSNNHTDFGGKSFNTDDCPAPFHAHLQRDMKMRGVEERLRYVTSIDILEAHLASDHAPISDDDFDARIGNIERGSLATRLVSELLGRHVDPEDGALPISVTQAFIFQVVDSQGEWTFADAAARRDGTWSARFTVDVDVKIETMSVVDGRIETVDKVVRVFGVASFGADDVVETLTVGGVEALPDDPAHMLWEQRAHWKQGAPSRRQSNMLDIARRAQRDMESVQLPTDMVRQAQRDMESVQPEAIRLGDQARRKLRDAGWDGF